MEAFGWTVLEEKTETTWKQWSVILEKAKSETGKGKPVCILLHTEMGYGVDFMTDLTLGTEKAPNDEQLDTVFKQLYLEAPADY